MAGDLDVLLDGVGTRIFASRKGGAAEGLRGADRPRTGLDHTGRGEAA